MSVSVTDGILARKVASSEVEIEHAAGDRSPTHIGRLAALLT